MMPMQGQLFPMMRTPRAAPPRRGWRAPTNGSTVPCGRFAGRPLRAVPIWYLTWLRNQTWLPAPLRAALKLEWARRFGRRPVRNVHLRTSETPDVHS